MSAAKSKPTKAAERRVTYARERLDRQMFDSLGVMVAEQSNITNAIETIQIADAIEALIDAKIDLALADYQVGSP